MGITRAEFGQAYDTGHENTIHFLMARGVPEQQAEDAAQAAWTRGWEKRETLRKVDSVEGWINSIALNIFRNDYRRKKRIEQLDDPDISTPPSQHGPRIDVHRGVTLCSERERRLLGEFYVVGYSSREIGRRHGLKPSTVRVRIFRAKQKLREFFARPSDGQES